MKPSSIIKILLKAVALPIMAMFMLNKWNLCEYITFIPEDYRFDAGLALYMAMLEAVAEFIEYFIAKANATITCTFYTDERREDRHAKPTIQMSDSSMGIASAWCHIILDGSYKKLSGTEICLDIPQWFSAQVDANSSLEQNNHQIKWNVSLLLPEHDNKKDVHTEMRMKISFIRNNENNVSIVLEPTIKKRFGLEFETNGITIQNVG
ncbi:hypothetical protein [uncultured Acetatifactor sp.]|uniref:hypothetical protein n=1 Tax=uncultured Acetatifactor sp. TaxID=1671927 RepID=UPI00272B417E|nr:hypothetical protein [uncultured Acetatifactor sp.]